jgi:hypothetical protein
MALNKERKVLLGLLGSAGLILAIDQFLLGSPSGAQASTGQQAGPTGVATTSPAASDTTTSPSASPSALASDVAVQWNDRLDAAIGDLPAATGSNPFADRSSAVEGRTEPGLLSVDEFIGLHQLSTIVQGAESSVAMVNRTPVRIGDEVSGYRLISIDARSALFQAGDRTARLVLPNQPDEGTP